LTDDEVERAKLRFLLARAELRANKKVMGLGVQMSRWILEGHKRGLKIRGA
jgi:ribosomal protein L15E